MTFHQRGAVSLRQRHYAQDIDDSPLSSSADDVSPLAFDDSPQFGKMPSPWTKVPMANPYQSVEHKETALRKSFSSSGGSYRGRNSDPESPPSGGVSTGSDCGPPPLGLEGTNGKQFSSYPKQQHGQWLLALLILGVAVGCLAIALLSWRQAPPQTRLRKFRFGGHQDNFVDLKICETAACRADCHRMHTAEELVVTGPNALLQTELSRHSILCDKPYFIDMRVCENPGMERTHFHPPHYSLYHDDTDSVEKRSPNDAEVCRKVYPGHPLHVNLTLPPNTTVYITVCADGSHRPIQHVAHCISTKEATTAKEAGHSHRGVHDKPGDGHHEHEEDVQHDDHDEHDVYHEQNEEHHEEDPDDESHGYDHDYDVHDTPSDHDPPDQANDANDKEHGDSHDADDDEHDDYSDHEDY